MSSYRNGLSLALGGSGIRKVSTSITAVSVPTAFGANAKPFLVNRSTADARCERPRYLLKKNAVSANSCGKQHQITTVRLITNDFLASFRRMTAQEAIVLDSAPIPSGSERRFGQGIELFRPLSLSSTHALVGLGQLATSTVRGLLSPASRVEWRPFITRCSYTRDRRFSGLLSQLRHLPWAKQVGGLVQSTRRKSQPTSLAMAGG